MTKYNFQKLSASVSALSIALGATAATSQSAEASTLTKTVNFAGSGPNVPQLFYDLGDDLTLTVTAGTHSGGAGANAPLNVTGSALISQSGGSEPGIGVRSGFLDSSELDAAGPDEFLRFTFSKEVTLLSTIFESARGFDEFDAGVDGIDLQITDTFGTDVLRAFPGAGFPGRTDRLVDFSGGVDFAGDGTNALFPAQGSVFDFYTDDSLDSYRIREIAVAHVSTPEPASLLGLLAVGTFGANSALKRKKAVS